jgi:hypothetical protein
MALSDSLGQLGSSLFQASQGIAVDLVREKLNLGGSSEKELIRERQQVDAINGSGAPNSREALKSAESVETMVTGDPVNKGLGAMTTQTILIMFGVGALAFFVWKK